MTARSSASVIDIKFFVSWCCDIGEPVIEAITRYIEKLGSGEIITRPSHHRQCDSLNQLIRPVTQQQSKRGRNGEGVSQRRC